MPSPSRRALGAIGEQAAAEWYVAHGYDVVLRNWRTRDGEIDLVCARPDVLVVCEVKTRTSDRFGSGFEAITPVKQQRIRRLALALLAAEPGLRRGRLRFDVAAVVPGGERPRVEVLEDAF